MDSRLNIPGDQDSGEAVLVRFGNNKKPSFVVQQLIQANHIQLGDYVLVRLRRSDNLLQTSNDVINLSYYRQWPDVKRMT